MRIAYVTTYDSTDVSNWSGLGYYIAKALSNQGIELLRVGPLSRMADFVSKAKASLHGRVTGKHYDIDRTPVAARSYAAQVRRHLQGLSVDAVFSPGTIPISLLDYPKPVIFWTDAVFDRMIDFYPGAWSNLSSETVRQGHGMEQAALSNARLAIYSSQWAANSALSSYRVTPAKVKVIPFGANIEHEPDLAEIKALVERRSSDGTCRLLFIGVGWFRKGGDLAIELARALNARGVRTQLTLVGSGPGDGAVPSFVSPLGFVSKSDGEGHALLEHLLAESHFLVLPSRADCLPVVIAEANAYGLPVVASNVGGIPDVVQEGVNGCAFDPTGFVSKAADFIGTIVGDRSAYERLSLRSFEEYQMQLNWRVAGRKVREALEGITESAAAGRPID